MLKAIQTGRAQFQTSKRFEVSRELCPVQFDSSHHVERRPTEMRRVMRANLTLHQFHNDHATLQVSTVHFVATRDGFVLETASDMKLSYNSE